VVGDTWNPDQYARFSAERSQPFYDLLALVQAPSPAAPREGPEDVAAGLPGSPAGAPSDAPAPAPAPARRVVDLGSGPGDLTRELHRRLRPAETVGVDNSAAMLARSAALAGDGLRFETGDISRFDPAGRFDLIFSNAALQWVPDHPKLLRRLTRGLAAGGQLAVQVPANDDHPSHRAAAELAGEAPFRDALGGYVRQSHILLPEAYASLLHALGFRQQHVRLQVYGHLLPGPEAVVEWVKGTLLTDYQRRLPPDVYDAFLEAYRRRLMPRLEASHPYFYPFKRILFWARL
jgi:trans-aconitate 2-methyltransferase